MPTAADIEVVVMSYILTEFLPGEDSVQLTNATRLISTGVLDSIATLRLVGFLEQQFSISIEAHEVNAEHFETIENITQLVVSKAGS